VATRGSARRSEIGSSPFISAGTVDESGKQGGLTSEGTLLHTLAGSSWRRLVIGDGFVIPQSCIAGWNELTLGFVATAVGAVATYLAGIGVVLRDLEPRS
jgi:hypothetical protein